MVGEKDKEEKPVLIARKRRLSRKEQKARKKQKRKQQQALHKKQHLTTSPKKEAPDIEHGAKSNNEKKVPVDIDFLKNYEPTPLPPKGQDGNLPAITKSATLRSLGKWFPKAQVISSLRPAFTGDNKQTASIGLFYQYATWSQATVDRFLTYLAEMAERRPLGGRIRLAKEGVNATISSIDSDDVSAACTLRHFCRDLQRFDPVFEQTDFKFLDGLAADRHFSHLKLVPVQELVYYGFDEAAGTAEGGEHVEATEFHRLLEQPSTVVVDVRNHYESAIGRFDGQCQSSTSSSSAGGATFIDPKMRKSTDFSTWLAKPETRQQLANKNVLMYCTGGVRCERASAYLNSQMGAQVKGVYQLQGGIERYLQAFPDGGHWRGKNFVFDKREAVSVDNPNGDGGVIVHGNKKQQRGTSSTRSNSETKCCICSAPWDRYVGKKKCHMCGVPVLVCEQCLSKHRQDRVVMRCPLCVEENVTVPVKDVEYTDNGVSSRPVVDEKAPSKKAATTVLKWGGGHAKEKKQKRKYSRIACKYGASCSRDDCLFFHPER